MIIKKLKLLNFKKHIDKACEFNDDINIIVGDNESGKSSLLEAIEICANFTYRGKPLSSELSTDLFNSTCVTNYLQGNLAQNTLPEILIELYLDGDPSLRGNNNSEGEDTEGIFVRVFFDPDLSDPYANFIANPDNVSTLPIEFYKTEWFSFAWNRMTHHNKKVNCLFVDPSRLHPTYGRSKYINSIINAALDRPSRSTLNLNYRQLKARFDNEADVVAINNNLDAENDVTDKSLKITADIGSKTNWESNLELTVDDVSFSQIGKGEQNQIQIKLALQNRAEDVDVIMLEEPENHLSHINLVQLISHIEKKNEGKQVFLTTHSSYVLNKLSINKLCLLSNEYSKLSDIDEGTIKTLKRLPGYDTLRAILAKHPILVEGPSDELLLKKKYLNNNDRLPEEDGIDIIVVRGIGFKTYLNIAKILGHPIRIVKDNDGDHQKNIIDWSNTYDAYDFITCFSPEDNNQSSLEPALIEVNSNTEENLDRLAKVMFSTQTNNTYLGLESIQEKKEFFENWYKGEGGGKKKVDSAIRIFESDEEIIFPEYLEQAINYEP
ncbi:ATP-dependent nuclease [Aquimarina macrocephali]|uniref:ATP-dependent nuclease n=1 Tax=Aquimarina macrocephali TaxID=666563 RepID=UPI000466250F|nr:AAA family ATPase [Aquimarina macrocephali]